MVWLIDLDELAACFNVKRTSIERIAERDLPVVMLRGRGERPNRRVDLEVVYEYLNVVSVTNSELAEKIKQRVHAARMQRLAEAAEARGEDREDVLPELVRMQRKSTQKATQDVGRTRPPSHQQRATDEGEDDESGSGTI